MTGKARPIRFVVCLDNAGYDVSLQVCKLYEQLDDAKAERGGLVCIVDESGEDYLYPRALFAAVELPIAASRKLARLGRASRRK